MNIPTNREIQYKSKKVRAIILRVSIFNKRSNRMSKDLNKHKKFRKLRKNRQDTLGFSTARIKYKIR
jgi:uncharacterized membrane protein YbaN (DUF454 family)